MYESFYGFRQKPFQITPDPAFLYKSEKHQNALAYLEYGLAENVGVIVLTGEIGSGKTTLVQYILARLDPAIDAAVVFNTNVTPEELLGLIMEEFDLPRQGDKAEILSAFNRFLVDGYGRGRRALLIIDEAQNLSAAALEEVRLLTNLQTPQQAILQVMLVGQPELGQTLKRPGLRQLAQRVAASYHLTGLDREETGRYVAHRLAVAGGSPEIFTPAALDLVFELSGGIPRAINLICQAALVYGFAEEAPRVSQDIIRQIQADNLGVGPAAVQPQAAPEPPPEAAGGGNGLNLRLERLESELRQLRDLMAEPAGRGGERGVPGLGREQFQQLVELIKQERREKESLLRQVTRLQELNKVLLKSRRQLLDRLGIKK